MSFLVMLLAVLLERFTRLRGRLQQDAPLLGLLIRRASRPSLASRPWLALAVVLLAILLPAGLLLLVLEPLFYGALLVPLHVLILLWSFGRGDLTRSLQAFRASWLRGDAEAASLEAERDLGVQAGDAPALLRQVQGYLLWQSYQGFFAVIFCYVLLGPLGALAYRLLALLAEQHEIGSLRAPALRLRHLLDWLPSRLLVLSLALAGNFVLAGRVLWPRLLDMQAVACRLVVEGGRAAAELGEPLPAGRAGVASLDALQQLLLRAGLVWASALALGILLF